MSEEGSPIETHPPRKAATLVTGAAVVVIAVLAAVIFIRGRSPQRSDEAFCSKMESAKSLSSALAELDPSKIAGPHKALREAQEVAPAEIEPQMNLLVTYVDELLRAIETSPDDPTKTATDWFAGRDSELAAVTTAGGAVQDYTREHCGLELDEAPRTIPD